MLKKDCSFYKEEKWTLEKINEMAKTAPEYLVKSAETRFRGQLDTTVDYILNKREECKVVLLSGPSSSGKTTTANMICNELLNRGVLCKTLSLDDFYKGMDKVPVLEDGTRDFESIEGLDVDSIRRCLSELISEGTTVLPIYDFSTMAPKIEKKRISLPKGGVIIAEGLHAISPITTEGLGQSCFVKIYIDVKKGIIGQEGMFFPPEFIRLMRRVQRDYKYRHTLPVRTVLMWKNVLRGENLYLKPIMDFADITIDSLHVYEPCVMAKEVLALMNSIPHDITIDSFTEKLGNFNFIDSSLVPQDSLMREFI